MTPAADHPERCLHEVWERLTAAGFAVGEPTPASCLCLFTGLRNAHAEMDLMETGALVWVYMPLAVTSPQQAAHRVLALLQDGPAGGGLLPARAAGGSLKDAAGQILAAAGMAARCVEVEYGPCDVCTEVLVTSPAAPARGHARISREGTIRWECSFATPASPASGLTPLQAAGAIAAALACGTVPVQEPAERSTVTAAPFCAHEDVMNISHSPASPAGGGDVPPLALVLPPGLARDQVLAGLVEAVTLARAQLAARAQTFAQRAANGGQRDRELLRGQAMGSEDAAATIDEVIVEVFGLWEQYWPQLSTAAGPACPAAPPEPPVSRHTHDPRPAAPLPACAIGPGAGRFRRHDRSCR
jgi:hypothetical protein